MSYPSSVPFSEIKAVLDVARSGNFKENAATVAYNAWIVQGYAQKMVFGDPMMLLAASKVKSPATDGANTGSFLDGDSSSVVITVLEKVVSSKDQMEAQASIPWDIILKYAAQLVITALQAAL